MHDESLDGIKADPQDIDILQEKVIFEAITVVAKHYKIDEDKATMAVGYIYKMYDDYKDGKNCIATIDLVAKKPITKMSQDERLMLLATGHLTRKLPAFKSSTKNIGRNEPCPCESGLKFKKCCLEMAKTNELEKWRNGK
jgi:hypothetical protein